MNNSHAMATAAHFERNKNTQASIITLAVCIGVYLLFFLLKWSVPQIVPVPVEEGIEVNLGDAAMGSGDIAPMSIGAPSESNTDQSNSSAGGSPAQSENTTTDDTPDPDAVATTATKPIVKPLPTNPTPSKPNPNSTATKPTPTPPKPKAVFAGGTSKQSGNNSEVENSYKNQGNDPAGTKGDKGNPNGNPNSDSYTGNASSGNGGVRIKSGLTGRKFAKLPTFEDDFNENAKVAVDIVVNATGNVTQAMINQKGTTTTNGNILNIAKRKAMQLKMTPGTEEQTGTIVFDFKLK